MLKLINVSMLIFWCLRTYPFYGMERGIGHVIVTKVAYCEKFNGGNYCKETIQFVSGKKYPYVFLHEIRTPGLLPRRIARCICGVGLQPYPDTIKDHLCADHSHASISEDFLFRPAIDVYIALGLDE